MHQFDERRYDEEKQRQIVALAAELQRDEATLLSQRELETAAEEAGIDPRHIRAAAQSLEQTQTVRRPEWPYRPHLLLTSLVTLNVFFCWRLVFGDLEIIWPWLGIFTGFLVALMMPRSWTARMLTLALAPASIYLISFAKGAKLITTPHWAFPYEWLMQLAITEVGAILLGFGLVEFARQVRSYLASKRQPQTRSLGN